MSSVSEPTRREASESVETLFRCFLTASSDRASEPIRTRLIEQHIEPLIRRIVARKMRVDPRRAGGPRNQVDETADELYIDALFNICRMLDKWRQEKSSPHKTLLDYVAMVTYNGCKGAWAGRRSSESLSEVTYHLTHRPGLALWQNRDHELLGGYKQWKDDAVPEIAESVLKELLRDPLKFAQAGLRNQKPDRKPGSSNPVELFEALLFQAEAPIELNALTAAYAVFQSDQKPAITEVSVTGPSKPGEEERNLVEELPDPSNLEGQTLNREADQNFLKRLWPCILKLQFPRHRAVLLLGCESDDIRLLPVMRMASFNQIAEAVGMQPAELAQLWNRLPLEDEEIASLLGTTKSKVKEMRQAAYRNLAWQMRPFDRSALNRLWKAAIQLEPSRPAVFMLRAHDAQGESLLALVNREEYADKPQIAEKLGLTSADLDTVWKGLPLAFGRIAGLLREDANRVIELYYDARNRLQRCLAEIEREE